MYRNLFLVTVLALSTTAASIADPTPAALVGTWEGGYASTIDFVNPGTGGHASPTGVRKGVHLYSNGRYEHNELSQASAYGCETGYFGADEGQVAVEGDLLHITIAKSRLHQWSTCSGRDFWRNVDPRRHSGTLRWKLAAENGMRYLILTQLNGSAYGTFRFIATK